MRIRPTWHRVVGGLQVALGIVIIVLNYAQWSGGELLPGGHNELWLLLGVGIGAGGSWWFGAFDRPT